MLSKKKLTKFSLVLKKEPFPKLIYLLVVLIIVYCSRIVITFAPAAKPNVRIAAKNQADVTSGSCVLQFRHQRAVNERNQTHEEIPNFLFDVVTHVS